MSSGSEPRQRRDSKEHPPDMSELMNKLLNLAASFIREFDSSEQKMRQIVREFREISDGVRKMPEGAGIWAGHSGTGGKGLPGFGGLFGWGGGLSGGLVGGLVAAAAAAVGGGAAVGGSGLVEGDVGRARNPNKVDESPERVKMLGKDFMKIIERLNLREIKMTCEKLEQRSAELQAEKTLAVMGEFQRTLRRVSEDRREIPHLADMCIRVVDDCDQMKKELKDFTEK
ncbi:uncharacterized protein LOC118492898 [Sander lucioperca]|uniref:uncharacterized protein LOC118492898 n=1 Tax=Sander lucioperca TaxID=283035 RepID=UPI00125DF37A|nr:uncharacterized protein LOC118492898 [Sander lucioperca]XP_031165394.1 uncharacterized protein LOC118492898 [Sander lucioperca]